MRWVWLLMLVGCGRIGFDPPGLSGDDTTTSDAPGNGDGAASDGVTSGGGQVTYLSYVSINNSGTVAQLNVALSAQLMPGDVIVVSVGWRDVTGTVSSVSDSRGTVYTNTVPLSRATTISQTVYTGVVQMTASLDSITVQFSAAVMAPSARVVAYHGADTANVQGGGGSGTGSTMGLAAFCAGPDWLVVGTNTATAPVASVPAPWATRVTTTNQEVVIDQSFPTSGLKNDNVPLTASGNWILQVVALPPK